MKQFFTLLCLIAIQTVIAIPLSVRIPPAHYVPNTQENVEALESETRLQTATSLSGQFEGDIILTEAQRDFIFFKTSRNGIVENTYRWPNNTIPYKLSSNHTVEQNNFIRKALDGLENVSCVKFVPHTNETDFVELHDRVTGCYSKVGRTGGAQVLNLARACFRLGTIEHEFLHALGFWHMQSNANRDDHLKIVWENIEAGHEHNFLKYNTTDFNEPYDYDSIMHYAPYDFSKNGYATIVPNDINFIKTMGRARKLTSSDIKKLNIMYNCKTDS